jgi:hypothetical protein
MTTAHTAPPPSPDAPRPPDAAPALRQALVALLLVGMLGLVVELLLLEHVEPGWQWAPFAVLALGVASGAALLRRPGARTVRLFRLAMAAFVVAGALGVYLHLLGNVEFEREHDPTVGGLALVWRALRGATPSLAPGNMAHLGLLGLLAVWRHPARRATPPTPG